MPRRNSKLQLEGLNPRSKPACLVTGGGGFIGSALLPILCASGWDVIATSQTPRHPAKHEGLSWITWRAEEGGVPACDWDKLDCIIHLANPRVQSRDISELKRQVEGGLLATSRLLEQAARHQVRRFVFVSTGDVVSPADGIAQETDHHYAATSFYSAAKASSELLVRSCAALLSTAIVRVYHPFGPGGDDFLINRLLAAVAAGRELTTERGGGILINPIWIDDLAHGLALAAASTATGVFHLAGPDKLRLAEFVRLAGRLLGKPVALHTSPSRPSLNHAGDCRRARRLLGWRPQMRLAAGLKKMIPSLEQTSAVTSDQP
jgi:nucleoside-diphosphate-sugar epimerase